MFVEHCPQKRGNARKTRTNWRKPYREWYKRGVRRPAGEEEDGGGRRRKMKRGFIMKGAEEERRRKGGERARQPGQREKCREKQAFLYFCQKKVEAAS